MRVREDRLTNQGHAYSFVQDEARHDEALELLSVEAAVGTATRSKGAKETSYMKSTSSRGRYRAVGTTRSAPDNPALTITSRVPRNEVSIIEKYYDAEQEFTLQVLVHKNADPTDTDQWSHKEIYEYIDVSDLSKSDTESLDGGQEFWQVDATATFMNYAKVFPIAFGDKSGELSDIAIDVAVYPPQQAGVLDENREIYVLTDAVGGVAPPDLVYRQKGVWASHSITELGTTDPSAIAVYGDKIIIVSQTDESYVYADRDDPTSWTRVAGFTASKGATCIFVKNLREIYMGGLGGYIYKVSKMGNTPTILDAGTLHVQNYTDIECWGDTILLTAPSNELVLSTNSGKAFSNPTGPSSGNSLLKVEPISDIACYISTDNAELWFCEDITKTTPVYEAVDLGSAGGTITEVSDVVFSQEAESVGYVAFKTASAAGVLRTTEGGGNWELDTLTSHPTATQIHALAVGGPNFVVSVGANSTTGKLAIAEM